MSQRKLAGYRATLQAAYGDLLRLRTYSVVARGFERLVWQELPFDGSGAGDARETEGMSE